MNCSKPPEPGGSLSGLRGQLDQETTRGNPSLMPSTSASISVAVSRASPATSWPTGFRSWTHALRAFRDLVTWCRSAKGSRSSSRWALVASAALALAACGPMSDEDEIRATVDEANAAATAGEFERLCRELFAPSEFPTERAKERCVRQLSSEPPTPASILVVDSVAIDGETARAEYTSGGFVDLIREDGRWYVATAG